MKNVTLIASCCLLMITSLHAQTWKWATGSDLDFAAMESWPIVVDKAGNAYELASVLPVGTGYLGYTGLYKSVFGPFAVIDSPGGDQMILVSVDSNGAYRWVLPVQTGQSGFAGMGIDTFGNIYVVGGGPAWMSFGGISFSAAFFCAKITTSGSVVWVKPFPPTSAVAVSPSGDIFVTGSFYDPAITIGTATLTNAGATGTIDGFVAAYDSSGTFQWATRFGGVGNDAAAVIGVSLSRDIYIWGSYSSPVMTMGPDTLTYPTGLSGQGDMFFAKFSPAGSPLWGQCMPGDSLINVTAIIADDQNNAYFTGFYDALSYGVPSPPFVFAHDTMPPAPVTNMIFGKYDSSGRRQWARYELNCQGQSLAFTHCGNLWLSGGLFGGGYDPAVLLEYDTSGALLDSTSLASGGDDQNTIAIDNNNNLYFGGDYIKGPHVIAGTDTLAITDSTVEALMVAKMHFSESCPPPVTTAVMAISIPAGVTLYPNPANDECTITCSNTFPAGSSVTVYGMEGRALRTYALTGNTTTIPTASLPPGMYICNIHQQGMEGVLRKLVIVR